MSDDAGSATDSSGSLPSSAGPWYDAEVVAREAMSKDPGLSSGLALRLAREAGELLGTEPEADAPELGRQLFMANRETGASPANCVATAAVAHRDSARRI